MSAITSIFQALGNVVSGFVPVLTSAFNSVVALVYDGEAITTLGAMLLIGAGIGMVYFVLRWVKGLIKAK